MQFSFLQENETEQIEKSEFYSICTCLLWLSIHSVVWLLLNEMNHKNECKTKTMQTTKMCKSYLKQNAKKTFHFSSFNSV